MPKSGTLVGWRIPADHDRRPARRISKKKAVMAPGHSILVAGAAELVQLRLTQPKLDRRLVLVWRPAASPPAGRAFLALARQHLTPPTGDT
jgi:hypothetical protein